MKPHAIPLAFSLFLSVLFATAVARGKPAALKPMLVQPDKVVLQEDFSHSGPLDKAAWSARQHTTWIIEDGVLRGTPSSAAYQASRKDHQGLEPRVSMPACPNEYALEFSIR